jgi:nucleolar GTP-binding protein
MEFESIPPSLTSKELLDKAFSRASRSGRAKYGVQAQRSMLKISSNILSDNLENIVKSWPNFDLVHPFYYELADIIVSVDDIRKSLGALQWASNTTREIGREYQISMLGSDLDYARTLRKQAFARMSSILRRVSKDLIFLSEAREPLRHLPSINPETPTIVVAGYPNVGKSSFVNITTNARNEIASYPFTTRGIMVGHIERNYIRYQLIDTPGLLDRSVSNRNDIEKQAISALKHLANCILFFIDASETCGYTLEHQQHLSEELTSQLGIPLITVCTKSDLSTNVTSDYYMSILPDSTSISKTSNEVSVELKTPEQILTEAVKYLNDHPKAINTQDENQ